MFEVKQGASTKIPFKLVSATDGITAMTGISSVTVYYSQNGGAATAWSSPVITQVSSQYMPGLYLMTPTTAMTNVVGPLVLGVTAAQCYPVQVVVEVVAAQQIDTFNQLTGVPYNVWNAPTSGSYATGSFGKNMEIARKILTNKTIDSGSSIVVYDDNGTTVLGTFSWVDSTGTRGKLI